MSNFIPISQPSLTDQDRASLLEAFDSGWISSQGEKITEFEKQFAQFCGTNHGISTSNGTTALHLALLALGIQPGDEVIIPDLTFAATINAALYVGATPVIVDVEEDSWCINPIEISKAITKNTKAIIPVHLYGQPANMAAIMDIAKANNLFVIEDAAEAHGAEFDGEKVGSIGDIGCFSFFANKIMTTGEGGMCITNNPKLATKIKQLRDHGMSENKRYWHDVVGYNYRMTNMQAAIGCSQLSRIESIINTRSNIENAYKSQLVGVGNITFQKTLPKRSKVTWMTSLLSGERNDIMKQLKKAGIDTRPFFYPLSSMPLYESYVFSNQNSTIISKTGFNLPTYTDLDINTIKTISNQLKASLYTQCS